MATKHTPGPWVLRESMIFGHATKKIPTSVATVHFMRPLKNHPHLEGQANARLIAAAPELLEACKAALAKCEFKVGSMKVQEALEAAVSKAEGAT